MIRKVHVPAAITFFAMLTGARAEPFRTAVFDFDLVNTDKSPTRGLDFLLEHRVLPEKATQ